MNTNELLTATPDAATEPVADPTGQLLLLPDTTVLHESNEHPRFRLSRDTRERGLRHVAEIRARLAAGADQSAPTAGVVELPRRRRPAA